MEEIFPSEDEDGDEGSAVVRVRGTTPQGVPSTSVLGAIRQMIGLDTADTRVVDRRKTESERDLEMNIPY
jgi:hypothetical protein